MLTFLRDTAATTDQIATQPDEFPPTVEAERDFLVKISTNPGSVILLAAHGGTVIGSLGIFSGERRRLAHAGTIGLSVDAAWRNQGVGGAMIRAILEWAAAHPILEKVCLSVFSSNEIGLALYRKLGFVEEGRRIGQAKLASERYVDEIHMGVWVKPPPPALSAK
ncbi:MAG: GNAT family N-acetyltransferase [Planctomycetes bacterium]|nr:GNAT family N-acetyltransferase [Planctomycetota bacterium]